MGCSRASQVKEIIFLTKLDMVLEAKEDKVAMKINWRQPQRAKCFFFGRP